MSAIHPCLYLLLLSAAVGLGLPAGALVVGAGALFGPGLGLLTVLLAEAVGLLLNWRLCRGVLRPKMERWLARTPKARLLEPLIGQPAGLKFLLLLRLALIPMNLVNAGCALGPTELRPYALACLALIPRFALMVLAGATGAESLRGKLSPVSLMSRWVAVAASAAVLLLLARRLQRQAATRPLPFSESRNSTKTMLREERPS
jgi:uncharacterized membrane protein YdjX (TVP38/TMEM64 family)